MEFEHDIEDLIQREDMVVMVTHDTDQTYRFQRIAHSEEAEGPLRHEYPRRRLRQPVCYVDPYSGPFSSKGIVYQLKVYKLPLGSPQARKAMVNLLPLEEGEFITTVMPLPEDEERGAASTRCLRRGLVLSVAINFRLRQYQSERQDSHEAGRRRRPRGCASLYRRG